MRVQAYVAVLVVAFSSLALASSRGQKARGAAVFSVSGCQHCHTINAVGGHKGPDLSGVGRRKSKAAMRQQIVYGSKVMPAFGDVLEPDELNDLIAYLRSCREKQAKTVHVASSD
jgi:mono/diheme cytochrome c family protein